MNHHISPDDMQRYHQGKIRELEELAVIEEHLMWCQECLRRLEALERSVNAVQATANVHDPDKELG